MTAPRLTAGNSLVEVLVVVTIVGILFTTGVPRAQNAFETARVDQAGAALLTIWSAQRMYWMEEQSYAPDLAGLTKFRLVEATLADLAEPFEYVVVSADTDTFTARATRKGGGWFSGRLEIDEVGKITGEIQDGNGRIFKPID